MYKIIYLNHNKITKVDTEDYKYLCKNKWRYNTTGYATRTFRSISMSRVIMKAKKGEYVDHVNNDKLDNRKGNLRIVTNQQNSWNKPNNYKNCNNQYRGIRKRGEKWQAYSFLDYKQINLGRYNTKVEAMKVYDKWITDNRGVYGITNKMMNYY